MNNIKDKVQDYIDQLKGHNEKAQEIINLYATDLSDTVQGTRLRMIHKYNYNIITIKELEKILK